MHDAPGPEPALPSIMPTAGMSSPEGAPVLSTVGRGPRPGGIMREARPVRYWMIALGVLATAIPAGPGLERTVEGRPGALPFLVLAGAIAIITVVLNTVVLMYQARQETLRKEIEYRSIDVLVAAVARCIDDAHAKAQNLPPDRDLEQAAQVRADARQLLTEVVPHITAVPDRDTQRSAGRRREGHQSRGRR
jgi:hypothetical protein